MERIGDRLKYQREKRGWTFVDVARRTKLSKSFVRELEQHKFGPGYWAFLELAELYHVSLDYLAGRK